MGIIGVGADRGKPKQLVKAPAPAPASSPASVDLSAYSDLPPDTDLSSYSDLPPDAIVNGKAPAPTSAAAPPPRTLGQNVGHAVGEFGKDLWESAKGFGKTLFGPPQEDENIITATPAARMIKGYVHGVQEADRRAKEHADEGDSVGTFIESTAAGVPLFGPLMSGIYRKSKGNPATGEAPDPWGAAGQGVSRALQVGAGGAGEAGVVGRVASAPARLAGRTAAFAAGTGVEAAKGAAQGFVREPGVVARPVNAAIEAATAVGRKVNPTPMLERMTKTPVNERFTPAEVKAHAEAGDYPIDMSAAEVSGQPTLQKVQAVGERSLTGGESIRNRIERGQRAISDRTTELKEKFSAGDRTPDIESSGRVVQEQTQAALQKLKSRAQTKFEKWLKRAGDIDVDLQGLNEEFAAKKAAMEEALANMPSSYSRPIMDLLKKGESLGVKENPNAALIADIKKQTGPRYKEVLEAQGLSEEAAPASVKMSSAQRMRSAYSDIANNFSGNIPSEVQRIAGELYHKIDAAMEASAKAHGKATGQRGIMKGYRDANADWSQMQSLYNTAKEPLYNVLRQTDHQKVVQSLIEPGSTGGSPRTIRVLRDQGIDLGPIQREVLDRIHNKNFGMYGKVKLGGYSDAFLQELFGPVMFQELHLLGKEARAMNYNVNPSGTAGVLSAGEDVVHLGRAAMQVAQGEVPAAAHIPGAKYIAAKVTNNPAFNEWMTNTKGKSGKTSQVEPSGREFRLGKGPGAMLAKGSELGPEMRPGPDTGRGKTLYHGTPYGNVPSIVREGIKTLPDQMSPKGRAQQTLDGRGNVYLTRNKSVAQGYAAGDGPGQTKGRFRPGGVAEVEVPESAIQWTDRHPEDLTGGKLYGQKQGEFELVTSGKSIPPQLVKSVEHPFTGEKLYERPQAKSDRSPELDLEFEAKGGTSHPLDDMMRFDDQGNLRQYASAEEMNARMRAELDRPDSMWKTSEPGKPNSFKFPERKPTALDLVPDAGETMKRDLAKFSRSRRQGDAAASEFTKKMSGLADEWKKQGIDPDSFLEPSRYYDEFFDDMGREPLSETEFVSWLKKKGYGPKDEKPN
jgi:hypothetical protein